MVGAVWFNLILLAEPSKHCFSGIFDGTGLPISRQLLNPNEDSRVIMQNNVISAGGGDSGPAFSIDVSFKGTCTSSRGRIADGVAFGVSDGISREACFKKCIDLEADGSAVGPLVLSGRTIESPKVTGIAYFPDTECVCLIDTGIGPLTRANEDGSTFECYPNTVRPSLILQHLILIICCPSSYCLDCRIELWFVYSVHFRRCVQRQNEQTNSDICNTSS